MYFPLVKLPTTTGCSHEVMPGSYSYVRSMNTDVRSVASPFWNFSGTVKGKVKLVRSLSEFSAQHPPCQFSSRYLDPHAIGDKHTRTEIRCIKDCPKSIVLPFSLCDAKCNG